MPNASLAPSSGTAAHGGTVPFATEPPRAARSAHGPGAHGSGAHGPGAHADGVARIGPNAVIQVSAAMRERLGAERSEAVLRAATGYTFASLPTEMIDEREPQALIKALVELVGPRLATTILRDAGHRTGDYLLANRIPRIAQWVMRALPRRVGLRLLLGAMQKNAWTFAGSGRFVVRHGTGTPELLFESCAMCRDMHEPQSMCDFYAGTFERLIRVCVARYAGVLEVECMSKGDAHCRFVLEGVT